MTRRGWSLVTHAGSTGAEVREDGDLVAIEQQEPWGKAQPVAPDGTVEVLRDGGR